MNSVFFKSFFTVCCVLVLCFAGYPAGKNPENPPSSTNELHPISQNEGNQIHVTQIVHSTYNPGGPDTSKNCGPASVAMALRVLGYLGARGMNRLTPEEQIDHARALMYPQDPRITTITRQDIPYTQLNLDNALSDVSAHAADAMDIIGGRAYDISTQAELDKAIDNGMPVVIFGYLDQDWRNQFPQNGHWGGIIEHYITVSGRSINGLYIVNDPMYQYGAVEMTWAQLSRFPQTGTGITEATVFFWLPPTPFALRKSNGRVHVFMRRTSDGYIYRSRQSYVNDGRYWGAWENLNGSITGGNPVAIEQPDGRILAFARHPHSGQLLMWRENTYGIMTFASNFGGETYYDPAVGKNADGRVEVYIRATDGRIFKRYQTNLSGNFSGWVDHGGDTRNGFAAVQNVDGRLEIFAGKDYTLGASTPITHTWQTAANNGWCGFWSADLGGHTKGTPVPILHGDDAPGDGWLRVFVRGGLDNNVYYKSQRDAWTTWRCAGATHKQGFGKPATIMVSYRDSSGSFRNDLGVYVRAFDNRIYGSRFDIRNNSYTWTDWSNYLGGICTSNPAVARFDNGRFFITVRGTDGRMWYRYQSEENGICADWAVLGSGLVF